MVGHRQYTKYPNYDRSTGVSNQDRNRQAMFSCAETATTNHYKLLELYPSIGLGDCNLSLYFCSHYISDNFMV